MNDSSRNYSSFTTTDKFSQKYLYNNDDDDILMNNNNSYHRLPSTNKSQYNQGNQYGDNNGDNTSPIQDSFTRSSPSPPPPPPPNKRIVFDQDGNLLKSFDYSEEILYKKENYTQANFDIHPTADRNKTSLNKLINDPITGNSSILPSSLLRNDYSLKSYLSNEKSNSDTQNKSNKLPSVSNGYIIKNTKPKPSNHKNSGKINNEKDKRDRLLQKLEKINTNTNMVYNNQYQSQHNFVDKTDSNIKKNSGGETILQPLQPLNSNIGLPNTFEKKKNYISNNNKRGKPSEFINSFSSPNSLSKISQYDPGLPKPTPYKTSRINSLLNDFKNGELVDYTIFTKDYLVSNNDPSENIKNNNNINSSNSSNNNNSNNNKKHIRESLMKIEEKNNKSNTTNTSSTEQLQNQSISRNSIMYLQNEEANIKAKNNFKSWIITNFANEWENQPWISLKCPEYNEWEKEIVEGDDNHNYDYNISKSKTKKTNIPGGIIESLPLKIAFLSRTIQHIYKNSSILILLYYLLL
ncbi:hypothetical protein PIROE2DRAFT_10917 [Piromyces sp. E2]|nr:hypothetical protein PIROE2DRAFT_10917 [Piromyces sp. E2]|eukprot:OUM62709.1 hypothetical protein PIROE2DRAFT_10917 [Piromyces sp. E2]